MMFLRLSQLTYMKLSRFLIVYLLGDYPDTLLSFTCWETTRTHYSGRLRGHIIIVYLLGDYPDTLLSLTCWEITRTHDSDSEPAGRLLGHIILIPSLLGDYTCWETTRTHYYGNLPGHIILIPSKTLCDLTL